MVRVLHLDKAVKNASEAGSIIIRALTPVVTKPNKEASSKNSPDV